MLLWAWFVDLKFQEAVLETWSLTYSINIYTLTRLASSRTSISDRREISPKLRHLTSCLWQKNPGFRKNSLCRLIWPDFDSFESADWPLKSSTNFQIWWKNCFFLWSEQVAHSKASQECSFRCKFEHAGPKRPVWHTHVLPRIAVQQYGDKNKLNWCNKFYYFLQFARVSHVPNKLLGTREFKFASNKDLNVNMPWLVRDSGLRKWLFTFVR